jgi:hypothetical protein
MKGGSFTFVELDTQFDTHISNRTIGTTKHWMDGGNMVVQGGNEAHSGPKQQVVES